jgi:hypothetical protein
MKVGPLRAVAQGSPGGTPLQSHTGYLKMKNKMSALQSDQQCFWWELKQQAPTKEAQ